MATSSNPPEPAATPHGRQWQGPLIDQFAVAELVAAGDADAPTGSTPVPISVWRVAEPDWPSLDSDSNSNSRGDGRGTFDAVLAGMIVASFGRRGDIVVSLGSDPALAGAAGAAGCDYRCVATGADLADLDQVIGRIALVVLRWPPDSDNGDTDPAALRDLFAACRMLLARGGATIVILSADPASDGYWQHGPTLITAARDSGLDLIRHIIARTEPVTGPHGRLRLTPTAIPVSFLDAIRLAIRQHILMFVIGGDRRD